jgi:hypothetical protein
MKPSSTQIKQVIYELIHNSRYPFEKSCIDLLRVMEPDIIDSKELGHFEREGIDAYTYLVETNTYSKAFQFKGFEVMEFGENQKNQCLKSINSFSKSDKTFDEYCLVSNLPIKDKALREEIEKEIHNKIKGKTSKAYLIDTHQFVDLLLTAYRKIILKKIEEYNIRVVSQYQNTVNQEFYYEEVPFTDKKGKLTLNPKNYLFNQSYNHRTSEFLYSKWRFIISEFGYGKTSLVQDLISKFKSVGINSIFIPVSSLSSEGLSNTTAISKEIAELIFESKLDFENALPQKLLFSIFKKLICSSNEMVLFFDGLDEHNFSYKFQGLKHIFTSFKDIRSPIFISMRKEFWEERQEDINLVLGKPEKNTSIVELYEWSDSNILQFLDLFQKIKGKSEKLDWFKKLINQNHYLEYFGDIPKRPLFLKMILNDLIEGNDATNSISKLYENYFLEKLKIDLIGYLGNPSRPLHVEGGIITKANIIMSVLEKTAIKMILPDTASIITLSEFIYEKDIEKILVATKINDVLEVLMHSVLMPFGSKELSGFKLKFAHKSYQEYFTARYLFGEIILSNAIDVDISNTYPQTVVQFVISMMKDRAINLSDLDKKKNCKLIEQILTN